MAGEPLTVGVFSPSVLLRTGRRLGLVDPGVREQPVASSPAQFAALLDGTLDAALTSPDNVIAHRFARADPLDVRIVSAVDRGLGLALYARPGLASVAELKGQAAGVDVPGSGFAFALYAAMEAVGLARGDYRTVALGSTPRRLDALLGGRCAATMLNAGSELRAEDAGAVRVAGAPRPYLGTVLCALEIGGGVRALAGALSATARAILAGDADTIVMEEAMAAMHLPHPTATRYLDRLKHPDEGLIADGRADTAALSTVLALRRRYGTAPSGDLIAQGLLDRGAR
ncbi:hypothetical protein FXF51_17725 [Nonomuraea sp. PA05]|uniref:ABC transporter substrate-binding protein n=1 Tax=Nonomuraea sp. PA05 TaxID=2604466 RepID=UPI0011D62CDB|nr:hypothetical protein [Nonomuraea sp. PA05]TYB66035.1 hypothetical protein FXF51_17725 [Nonomuraea sp. PA05]